MDYYGDASKSLTNGTYTVTVGNGGTWSIHKSMAIKAHMVIFTGGYKLVTLVQVQVKEMKHKILA